MYRSIYLLLSLCCVVNTRMTCVCAWLGLSGVLRNTQLLNSDLLFVHSLLPLLLLMMMLILMQSKIKETFVAFDTDQNGEINMTELRALLGRLGEMPSEKHLQVGWDAVDRASGSFAGRGGPWGRSIRLVDSICDLGGDGICLWKEPDTMWSLAIICCCSFSGFWVFPRGPLRFFGAGGASALASVADIFGHPSACLPASSFCCGCGCVCRSR